MGFSLFSSFRDPDQFRDRPPPTLFRIFWKLSVRPKISSGYFWNLSVRPWIFLGYFWKRFVRPWNLSRIFLDKFLENNFPFSLQHEFLIKLSQTNFHLLEFVCGYKSSFTPVIRPLDSDCGFCLSCAVFEQLSQLLSWPSHARPRVHLTIWTSLNKFEQVWISLD